MKNQIIRAKPNNSNINTNGIISEKNSCRRGLADGFWILGNNPLSTIKRSLLQQVLPICPSTGAGSGPSWFQIEILTSDCQITPLWVPNMVEQKTLFKFLSKVWRSFLVLPKKLARTIRTPTYLRRYPGPKFSLTQICHRGGHGGLGPKGTHPMWEPDSGQAVVRGTGSTQWTVGSH